MCTTCGKRIDEAAQKKQETYATLCQATFELLELEENHLCWCGTKGCPLCHAIRRTRTALEEVNT